MKPYGQKQEKNKVGTRGFNNSYEWKVSKSRERHDNEEVKDFLNTEEITEEISQDELEQ